MVQATFNHPICGKCKGKECCQKLGCSLAPCDFGNQITEQVMIERLKKDILFTIIPTNKRTSLPIQHQGRQCYGLLVPRIKGRFDTNTYFLLKRKKNNPCMYWSYQNGCKFKDGERPHGGASLIPNKDNKNCINPYEGSSEQENDWMPYQNIIIVALEKLGAL